MTGIALDTNVLAYAESVGRNDIPDPRETKAIDLIERLPSDRLVIPVQVLGELFNVLIRKQRRTAGEARARVGMYTSIARLCPTTETALAAALSLAATHDIPTWDAVILAVAAESGCTLLLSEDFQHGFAWNGITVVNPFAQQPHPLLAPLI